MVKIDTLFTHHGRVEEVLICYVNTIIGRFGLFGLMVIERATDQFRVLLHHVLPLEVCIGDVSGSIGHLVGDLLTPVEALDINQVEGV